ncbi:hypothetical protein AVEN_265748-1 [Araneus ventricosus]|uniref:Uncharacterized protein n=1 Tax=Araneus ventricosus TaxID=182803 RepID=A0A4Y2VHV5_ARAVE|nr:hypothetical protein AVEN_265748-1 [Araneus ventricosus]
MNVLFRRYEEGRMEMTFAISPYFWRYRRNYSDDRDCTRASIPFSYLHRFGLCSHDRCVCGDKGNPNHYSTRCQNSFISGSPGLKTFRRGL